MPTLYLIPTPLESNYKTLDIPQSQRAIISSLHYFIVESNKCAAKFLSIVNSPTPATLINPDTLAAYPNSAILSNENNNGEDLKNKVNREFFILNEHTNIMQLPAMLKPLDNGFDMGLLSDAGCPCVGDPGRQAVIEAQKKGYRVVPLIGPNAFIMAVMASGLNGQSFAFNGYIPIKNDLRRTALQKLEKLAIRGQTQGFIETPYRNMQLFNAIITNLQNTTLLCVACNITANDEYIATKSIAQWKKLNPPDLHKKPCIFLIGVS